MSVNRSRAIIAAAGRGSRLGPSGVDAPKCLTEVGGERLIDSQMGALHAIGIRDITLVGGYRIDHLRALDCILLVNQDWQTTSMLQSIRIGLEGQEAAQRTFIVYGDIYLCKHALIGGLDTMTDISVGYITGWKDNWSHRYSEPLSDLETFKIDSEGFVRDIGGTPAHVNEIEGQFAGVLSLTRAGSHAFLNELARTTAVSTTEFIACMMELGHAVGTFVVAEPWFEIDTERDLAFARSALKGGQP